MDYPVIVQGFLQRYLSPTLAKRAILPTLQRAPEIYVGRLQKHLVDMLYTVNSFDENGETSDEEAFIWILFEHKSKLDRLLPLQLDRYRAEIWATWRKQRQKADQPIDYLPPLCPIIVYHGTASPYPESTDIRDLFADKALAKAMFD